MLLVVPALRPEIRLGCDVQLDFFKCRCYIISRRLHKPRSVPSTVDGRLGCL